GRCFQRVANARSVKGNRLSLRTSGARTNKRRERMPRTQFSHPRVKSGSPTVSSLCSVFVISLSIFGARASSTSVHTPGMLLHTFSQGIGREESSLEGQLWCNPKGSKRWPMLPTAQPNDASNTTVPRMPWLHLSSSSNELTSRPIVWKNECRFILGWSKLVKTNEMGMSPEARNTYDQYKGKKPLKDRFLHQDRKTESEAFSFASAWDEHQKFLSLANFLH
uniref:Uncharacterized protein n=1 Tax=Cucumis melo TaxID=3656 RepID=A0A9I9EMG0_CUCME